MARELRVEFKGDASDLVRASHQADDAVDKVGKSAGGIGGALAGLAGPAGIAVAGIGAAAAIGYKFAQAAAEDEQSQKSLANVLKKTAGATDDQVAANEKWISKVSQQVAVADDDLRPALQRLAGATHSTSGAQALLTSALDIAAGTGKPLTTVVEALTKAQLGQTTGLGKLGLETKDAAGNQLSFATILEQSKTSFGGLAEAATNTASGGMAKAKIAFGEMQEQIGGWLLPILGKLAAFFSDVVMPAIQRVIDYVQQHWPQIMAAIQPVIDAVVALVKDAADTITKIFQGPIGSFLLAMVKNTFETIANIIGPALRVVKGIIDVFGGLLTGDWGKLWNGVKAIVSGVWDGVVAILTGTWDRIKIVFGALADLITAPFKAAFNAISNIWNSTVGRLSFKVPDWVPVLGGKGWDVPDLPTWGGRAAPAAAGVNVFMPTGTDPYATVAALATYTARVAPLDLGRAAIR